MITVFGCGGDRDRAKRPLMGEAAGRGSDFVVLTSDNPRSEDPLAIMNDAMVGLQRSGTKYKTEPDRKAPSRWRSAKRTRRHRADRRQRSREGAGHARRVRSV